MSETAKKPQRLSAVGGLLLQAAALIFWSYALTKIFIFDLDSWFVQYFAPRYLWALQLRFLMMPIILSISLMSIGRVRTLMCGLYVIFYPLIVVVWKIPRFIWKQKSWIIAFSFINATITAFASFKRNMIIATIYGCGFTVVLLALNKISLWAAVVILAAALTGTFVLRFLAVFKPTPVFMIYRRMLEWMRDKVDAKATVDASLRVPMSALDQTQIDKWKVGLFTSVLENRCYLFAARRLRDYQDSGLGLAAEIVGTVYLFCGTVAVFAFINLGLYEIKHSSFVLTVQPSIFQFFYYSFNAFVMNSIPEIAPGDILTQAVSMAEKFFALMLMAIFASLLISVRSQRSSKEVDGLISILQHQGRSREIAIADDYKLNTIEEAMDALEKLQSGMVKLLVILSNDIRRGSL